MNKIKAWWNAIQYKIDIIFIIVFVLLGLFSNDVIKLEASFIFALIIASTRSIKIEVNKIRKGK